MNDVLIVEFLAAQFNFHPIWGYYLLMKLTTINVYVVAIISVFLFIFVKKSLPKKVSNSIILHKFV